MTTPAPSAASPRSPALFRLGAVPIVLSLAGGLLVGLVLNRVLDHAIVKRTEASALALLARVGPDVETVLGSGQDPKETIDRLGRQVSLRATLVGTDGRVLADSGVDRARVGSLENHANRPEVQAAREHGTGVRTRFSSTLGSRLVYAAVRLHGGEVLRLAFPEEDLSRWDAPYRHQTLGFSAFAGLLVAALLVRLRIRHATELTLVRGAVAAVERGERPAGPGPVSEEAAAVFSALGGLQELIAGRDAGTRRDAAVSRAVFDEVPIGLLVVDPRLSLLDANPEAVRLLGARPEDVRRGEHVLELVREKSVADLLQAALASGRHSARITLSSGKGGRLLEASAVRLDEQAMPGQPAAVGLLREIASK